jgi:hypothetical protein
MALPSLPVEGKVTVSNLMNGAEQETHKPLVTGSSPVAATYSFGPALLFDRLQNGSSHCMLNI